MLRRSPMPRPAKPLRVRSSQASSKRLRANEGRARQIVINRASPYGYPACEICLSPYRLQWHHRKNRSQGGLWAPSNGLLVCAKDHEHITEHPAYAVKLGYTVLSHQEPHQVPVNTVHGYVLLDDMGGTRQAVAT